MNLMIHNNELGDIGSGGVHEPVVQMNPAKLVSVLGECFALCTNSSLNEIMKMPENNSC